MEPDQKKKYRNLLSISLNKFFDEDLKKTVAELHEKSIPDKPARKKDEKQVKKVSSKTETRLWIRFSRAFRKKQRLKAAQYATDFLNQFPESKKISLIRKKTHKLYRTLFRRSGPKWKALKKKFEKQLLKAPLKDILFWANQSYNQGYYSVSLDLTERAINQRIINNSHVNNQSSDSMKKEINPQIETDRIPELLILAGRSAYNQVEFQKAKTHFQTLIKKHKEHSLSHEARYLLGLLHYRQKNYKKVISIYNPLFKNPYYEPWELQILYWLWRSLKKTSPSKTAEVAEIILKKFPLTYYGLIVRQHEKSSLQSLIFSENETLSSISWETRGTEKQWERIKKITGVGLDKRSSDGNRISP